jgi:hypothetical protein
VDWMLARFGGEVIVTSISMSSGSLRLVVSSASMSIGSGNKLTACVFGGLDISIAHCTFPQGHYDLPSYSTASPIIRFTLHR